MKFLIPVAGVFLAIAAYFFFAGFPNQQTEEPKTTGQTLISEPEIKVETKATEETSK